MGLDAFICVVIHGPEFKQALEMANQGARKVYELQREALLRKYFAGATVETTTEEVGE